MSKVSLKSIHSNNSKIKNLNLEVEDNEFMVILGSKDSENTAILKTIAGLETISKGELVIGDKVVNEVQPKDRDIAMVFNNYALYPHMSVYENMAFGLKLRKLSKEEMDKKILDAAKLLEITNILDKKPKVLSIEEKQKVAIGRAIVREPKVLLMDDPLSKLPEKSRSEMRGEILKLHKSLKTTIIYTTHDKVEAMSLGTRLAVVKSGTLQQIGVPMEVYNKPANIFVASILGNPHMNLLDAKLAEKKDRILVVFGEEVVILPEDKSKILKENGYVGKEVIFGIRPEDIKDEEEFVSQHEDGVVKLNVDIVETMGYESYLHLSRGKVNLVARTGAVSSAKSGDKITVALDENKIHIFDKETGISII